MIPTISTADREDVVIKLFEWMSGIYGKQFAKSWEGVDPADMKKAWQTGLQTYSMLEIGIGLDKCTTKVWPPTLPEFLLLCRPSIDPESAFHESVAQLQKRELAQDAWSHPAIFWTACKFPQQDVFGLGWFHIKSRWTSTLENELAKRSWDPIPPKLDQLPVPGRSIASPETVKTEMAKITEFFARNKPGKLGVKK